MKKISLEEFVKLINNATKKREDTKIRIRDEYNIFSVRMNKESVMNLHVPEKCKYNVLFEHLKKHFAKRYQVIWEHDICGKYEAYMIIDEKVIVDFDYGLTEGQNWLHLHEGE